MTDLGSCVYIHGAFCHACANSCQSGLCRPGMSLPPNPRFWLGEPPEEGDPDLIAGLLKRHARLLITGETDVGKTLIGLEVAYSMLTGDPLWGKLIPIHTVSQVTYVMGEHDKEYLKGQWALLGRVTPPGFWVLPPPGKRLVARGDTLVGHQMLYRGWCEGSGLVIFDPLGAFASGVDVENDNAQMRAVIDAMSLVAHPGALLVFAHMGKPTFDPKEGSWRRRESYATRGGSAIEDAVTECFYMEKDREHGETFILRRRKFKGQAPAFFRLSRDPLTLRHTLTVKGLTDAERRAQKASAGGHHGSPKIGR